jgi:hypothetical protein
MLADCSDADLIEELAKRLGLTTICVTSDSSRGVRPPDGVSAVISDEMTQGRPFPARGVVADDYPADASAQGTIGTPAQ